MFYQVKRIIVKEGYGEGIIENFTGEGIIEKQHGFINLKVLEKKISRGNEEIMVLIQWESEEDWKNWEKSPEHLAGHKAKAGKVKPAYLVDSSQHVYYVRSQK
ncbi:antibiotic biosynthesis monooxygenase [Cytobacillus spongiae]|jgi:heme oxygenase (staphylobilin-producing)|uniref:antibiotic biosynthesis monooxygenase family protein n=1 Tax=Cytobacillus spongiae TaxID=2901381 RepID=UPI001F1CA678|nr:antibiotic biosynthesis monooxygenase [Cytobacillus spongiae]UII55861.1 antibiotic biosynthesis monooxygenase [Cytobacillus spongiae]